MTGRLLGLVAVLFVAQGPASFEGTIKMRNITVSLDEPGMKASWLDVAPATLAAREDAKVEQTTMRIRNNVIRLEPRADATDSSYGLMDLGRGVMTMIVPGERMYLEFPMPMAGGNQPAARPGAPAAKAIGQRTINGMQTTGYEVRTNEQIVRAWMTTDHPGLTWTFTRAATRSEDEVEDPEADAVNAALAGHGFPVLMITLTEGSLEVAELVQVQRAPLPAAMFAVPAGFTKRAIPGR